jgi:hypothetical protein
MVPRKLRAVKSSCIVECFYIFHVLNVVVRGIIIKLVNTYLESVDINYISYWFSKQSTKHTRIFAALSKVIEILLYIKHYKLDVLYINKERR